MYIPKINVETDREKIVAFMKRFSFATIVTANDNFPIATHLPFLVSVREDTIVLTSHYAKANEQWRHVENNKILVIFTEPHAYISPTHYEKEVNVPTWNYMAVHVYGQGKLITENERTYEVLDATIANYETSYKHQWQNLPDDYKLNMAKGIVAFEVVVTELQAKQKLSQNRTEGERQTIMDSLKNSKDSNEQLIAHYMQQNQVAGR